MKKEDIVFFALFLSAPFIVFTQSIAFLPLVPSFALVAFIAS